MPRIRIHPKTIASLLLFTLSVLVVLQFQLLSSAQTNWCPGNIFINGTFTGGVAPSSAAYGTPDWSPGQVGMWGNMNPSIGEGLKQTITLVAGKTYNGTLSYRIVPGDNKQPDGRIRIRLSSSALNQWGTNNTIFLSPMTLASATNWTPANFTFVAPASSQVLTINVENTLSANDGTKTSYGVIKDVCIQQAPEPGVPVKKVCQGQQVPFTGSAASSWNWDFGDGGTSTQQNPTHVYSTAGTFPVKLCVNGTTNCTTTSIVVNALPPTPVISGPASSCGNQNATYTVPATPGMSYSWTATNGTINGSSTGPSVNVTWNSSGVGVIGVTVTNKAGCSVTIRKEVIGCDLHLPCCQGFFAKTDLKSLSDAGNNIYNLTPTLSANQPGPYVRVTANIISANATYSSPNCGKAGPIVATIAGASPSNPGGFNPTIPMTGGHEVIWYGPGANVNGVDFPMQIQLPPAPGGHCIQYITICIKYTFTNKECKTCEVIRCYTFKRGGLIKDLTEFTDNIKLHD